MGDLPRLMSRLLTSPMTIAPIRQATKAKVDVLERPVDS